MRSSYGPLCWCYGLLNSRRVTHDSDLICLLIADWIAYCTNDSDLVRLLIADWIAYYTDDSDWFACLYIKDCAAVERALSSTWLAIYHQLNLPPSEPLYLYHRH